MKASNAREINERRNRQMVNVKKKSKKENKKTERTMWNVNLKKESRNRGTGSFFPADRIVCGQFSHITS